VSSYGAHSSYIVLDQGICGGHPRIAGTRLKVQHIVIEYVHRRWSPNRICEAHPGVTLAQVHAALSYYYDHQRRIDHDILEAEDFAEGLRKQLEARKL
jgi:uncharacterized protein (DUF433 family)